MNKKVLLAIFLIGALVLGNTAALFYLHNRMSRVVVVDVIQVFNEFAMKKDLEARVEGKLRGYTEQLDSLNALYGMMHKDSVKRQPELTQLAQNMATLQQEAQQAYEISNKTINEQVWLRLNTLIEAYGKEHNYRIIIGANGMGTVLYNEGGVDKTTDLIAFINRRYEKGS